ncbi:MAG: hypothetical protein Q9225_005893 [Loekoesia sp. 1 TL-2023]
MTLNIPDSILYNASLTVLSSTTALITLLIFILTFTARFRRPWEPPSFSYWLLAHKLQNYLALLNLIEILLLLVSFAIVTVDRHRVCATQLSSQECEGFIKIWKGVSVSLIVLSVLSGPALYPIYRKLHERSADPGHRNGDILNNRPYVLFIAHLFLQASATTTLTSSFSSLFFEPADVHAALKHSVITGACAIIFFDLGIAATFWGILKYHLTMQTIREEARERRFGTTSRLNWGRGVAETAFYGKRVRRKLETQLDYLVGVTWERRA